MATFSKTEQFPDQPKYAPLIKKALLNFKPNEKKKFFYYKDYPLGAKKVPLVLVDFDAGLQTELAKKGQKPAAAGTVSLTSTDELDFQSTTGRVNRKALKVYLKQLDPSIRTVYIPSGADDGEEGESEGAPSVAEQPALNPQMERKVKFEEDQFQKRQAEQPPAPAISKQMEQKKWFEELEFQKRELKNRVSELQGKTFQPGVTPQLKQDTLKRALELISKGDVAQATTLLDGLTAKVAAPVPKPGPAPQAAKPAVPPPKTGPAPQAAKPATPPPQPAPPRTKVQEEIARRRVKTKAAFAKLPPGYPGLPDLMARMKKANELADGVPPDQAPDPKAAAAALAQLKKEARRAATQYAASLNGRDTLNSARSLLVNVRSFAAVLDKLESDSAGLLADIGKTDKVGDAATVEEALERRKNFAQFEPVIRAQAEGAAGARKRAIAFATAAPPVKDRIEDLAHQVATLQAQKNPPTKELAEAHAALTEAARLYRVGSAVPDKSNLAKLFAKHDADLEAKLKEWKDLGKLQQRGQEKAPPQFASIEQREQNRLGEAKRRFLEANAQDIVLGATREPKRKVEPERRFDTMEVVDELEEDLPLAEKLDDQKIAALVTKVTKKLQEVIDAESKKPNSDVIFDLALKTQEEFAAEMADSLGLDINLCSPDQKKLIEQMATKAVATAKKLTPNKMSAKKVTLKTKDGKDVETAEEISLNGQQFEKPKFLGQGGLGKIFRYEEKRGPGDTGPPKYVVVKSLNDPEQRDGMVHELRVHRHAMGGEDGEGHPNVVTMRGAVRGEDDSLHMILDYEGGGDLGQVTGAVNDVAERGGIPRGAQVALNQYFFKQAVGGMKHVQDQNMTHHDIKDMNYLVSEDGTVKVADFGSGQVSREDTGAVSGYGKGAPHLMVTPAYVAPDVFGKQPVTGKADTYTLGTMLQKMSAPDTKKFGATATSVTALDRLKNSMMDPDPAKRPTLEAVEYASCLNDADANYDEAQIKELIKATMAYSKAVASDIDKLERVIGDDENTVQVMEARAKKRQASGEPPIASEAKTLADAKQRLAANQALLKGINERDDNTKALYAALQKASTPFK